MNKYTASESPHLAANVLSVLERLTTFPTEPKELNTWWVAEFGAKPSKPKKDKGGTKDADSSSEEEEADWSQFFAEEKSFKSNALPKFPGIRLRQMTIHQSLHSLSSHQAVFTRAWLALLPRLSVRDAGKANANATRVLNILHRGVMPHFTRPILLMDWITSCVDFGMCSCTGCCLYG